MSFYNIGCSFFFRFLVSSIFLNLSDSQNGFSSLISLSIVFKIFSCLSKYQPLSSLSSRANKSMTAICLPSYHPGFSTRTTDLHINHNMDMNKVFMNSSLLPHPPNHHCPSFNVPCFINDTQSAHVFRSQIRKSSLTLPSPSLMSPPVTNPFDFP